MSQIRDLGPTERVARRLTRAFKWTQCRVGCALALVHLPPTLMSALGRLQPLDLWILSVCFTPEAAAELE